MALEEDEDSSNTDIALELIGPIADLLGVVAALGYGLSSKLVAIVVLSLGIVAALASVPPIVGAVRLTFSPYGRFFDHRTRGLKLLRSCGSLIVAGLLIVFAAVALNRTSTEERDPPTNPSDSSRVGGTRDGG